MAVPTRWMRRRDEWDRLDDWEDIPRIAAEPADEFTRIFTQIRAGLVRLARGVSRLRTPAPRPESLPVPRIAHGEVTTASQEGRGVGQLTQHATQGYVRRGRPVGPEAIRGNRGIAVVNPDGSVDYTVYSSGLRTILFRRRICGAGCVPTAHATGSAPGSAQVREDVVRTLLAQIPTIEGSTAMPPQIFGPHNSSVSGPDLLPIG